MPCISMVATCSGRSRRARMPPCTLGCSVLTRPSSISGKPVYSLTSITARPASRSALAVPPVESSSTPALASVRAKSTRPVLSDTESRARCIFIWRWAEGSVGEAVFAHFLAQGVAVDAEHVGRARLVAFRTVENVGEQGLFHRAQDHVVDLARHFAVEILEIAIERPPHAGSDFVFFYHFEVPPYAASRVAGGMSSALLFWCS